MAAPERDSVVGRSPYEWTLHLAAESTKASWPRPALFVDGQPCTGASSAHAGGTDDTLPSRASTKNCAEAGGLRASGAMRAAGIGLERAMPMAGTDALLIMVK